MNVLNIPLYFRPKRTTEEKLNMLANPRVNAFIRERDKTNSMLFTVLSRHCLQSIINHQEAIEFLTLLKNEQDTGKYLLVISPRSQHPSEGNIPTNAHCS
jgi:hypothetical protein